MKTIQYIITFFLMSIAAMIITSRIKTKITIVFPLRIGLSYNLGYKVSERNIKVQCSLITNKNILENKFTKKLRYLMIK